MSASTLAPPPTQRRKNVIGWAIVVLLVAIVTLVALRIGDPSPRQHGGMDPEGRGWNGTMALAELLRDQGVDVTVTRSRLEAVALQDAGSALVFTDPAALSDEAIRELAAASDYTVVLDASTHLLDLFEMGSFATVGTRPVDADCDWPPFSRVGEIVPNRMLAPADDVTACFADADGSAAVLVAERDGGTLLMLDGRRLLTNENLARDGNAALGLALLGQRDSLVWYVPSVADSDREWLEDPTLGELTPGWVSPAIVALALAGLAAALWRGRRFGPLVAETLPVTVRASETMHGRARLTAKAADAAHAAEALRTGTLVRLAKRTGLGEQAAASDVSDSVADRLQVPRSPIRALLTGELPASDPDLISFARRLDELEQALEAAVHTERKTP